MGLRVELNEHALGLLGGDGYRMPSIVFLLKDQVSPGENIDV